MARTVPSIEMKSTALYNYWAFLELISFQGGTAQFADIHWELANFISSTQLCLELPAFKKKSRRLIEISRGYLKSTLVVGYVLWRIYRNPAIRVLYGTNIKDLSQKFLREMRQWLEDPWLRRYIWDDRPHIEGKLIPDMDRSNRRWSNYNAVEDPDVSDNKKVIWNNTQIQVVRPPDCIFGEPTVFSTSVETRVTGQHYDLVVLDDIVDFMNSATPAGIRKTQVWGDDMENVVNRNPRRYEFEPRYDWQMPFVEWLGDEVITLGTHYDPNDYYTYLENNVEDFRLNTFIRNIYVNGLDNTDGYNWGEHMNEEMELYLRKRLKDSFYPQYLNVTISEIKKILDADNIVWLAPHQYTIHKQGLWGFCEVKLAPDEAPIEVKLHIAVDPAASLKTEACDTAIVVGGVDKDDRLYVFEVFQDKVKPSQLCKKLKELSAKWHTRVFIVETVGYQLSLKWTIEDYFKERSMKVVVREFLPSGDKQMRIETQLEPHFSEATIYMAEHLKDNPVLMSAIKYFGSTINIDTLDAIAILKEEARPGRRKKGQPDRDNVIRLPVNKRYGGVY